MTVIRTILKSKIETDGRHQVLLMLSERGERSYFVTGFTASPDEFDASKEGGRFHQGRGVRAFTIERKEEDGSVKKYTNKEANETLAGIEDRARRILKSYGESHLNWTFERFREDFLNLPKREFFKSFAEMVIEKDYVGEGRYKKAAIAKGALVSLEEYDTNFPKRLFEELSVSYLQAYIKKCRDKGHSENTIGIRLREIRRIFNVAIRDKVIGQEMYPFSSGNEAGKVKIPKAELTKTDQYLTLENLKLLACSEFKNYVLERTKHLFLFSYYSRGMNWKDMALLTNSNFYRATVTDDNTHENKEVTIMRYKRSKTKGAFDIIVTPNIQRELDWFRENTPLYGDYVLPIIGLEVAPQKLDDYLMQVRKRFNASLKKIAEELEFPESQRNITIYSARHSFAMTLKNKDKSIEIISQALGHQSVETTKHYLAKFSTTKMAEETDIDLLT
ncbi:MAG: site-specific integrase [Bacteroidales bacterium]|nr:site-specific integrase [Bacteroidales bacterium]